jgi:predicted nucleic acid-binding protein
MNETASPPRVFFDTSVVIAGAFSSTGASYILLQLAGLTLLDGRISPDVRTEALRNVTAKLPAALPQLRVLLNEVLKEGAPVTNEQIQAISQHADVKDQPLLASAVTQQCRYLVTLNQKDFWPPSDLILISRPGELLRMLRTHLANL